MEPTTHRRMRWSQVPDGVRAAVTAWAGEPLEEERSHPGGFSPGVASTLRAPSGRRWFVKAVGPAPNPTSRDLYRVEAAVAGALPEGLPTPRLRWSWDDGQWVALVFDQVDGRQPDVRRPDELAEVLHVPTLLAGLLDPSPLPRPGFVAQHGGPLWDFWAGCDPENPPPGLAASFGAAAARGIPAWAQAARDWREAISGTALAHCDLRPDNMVRSDTSRDGSARIVVVDWPWACLAVPWLDLVAMLPVLACEGVDPESVVRDHPLTRDADPAAVTAVLASLAGFFVGNSLLPPPPGLPALRRFQRAQARTALAWLARRVGAEGP